MSRANYNEDMDDNWSLICWRGAVTSATHGKRGQQFLRDLLAAMDALPEPLLIANELQSGENVCTIGALGKARGIDMSKIDPEDSSTVSGVFGIADALAREVVYMNDEGSFNSETHADRFKRMRAWVVSQIKEPKP